MAPAVLNSELTDLISNYLACSKHTKSGYSTHSWRGDSDSDKSHLSGCSPDFVRTVRDVMGREKRSSSLPRILVSPGTC